MNEISIKKLAYEIGTPFYCYNANYILDKLNYYKEAFKNYPNYLIAYALKANSNQAIIKLLANNGSGADIVSLGELHRACKASISPCNIIFSGVGKKIEEIDHALNTNIGCFNIESSAEFELIEARAQALNKIAPIALRINPDVKADTHPKIATGNSATKFGLDFNQAKELYQKAALSKYFNILGIDVHIGSQICDITAFDRAFSILKNFIIELKNLNIHLQHVDIGGGLGIDYSTNFSKEKARQNIIAYIQLAIKYFSPMKIICEPGRSIVGNSGILVSRTIYQKQNYNKNFIIIDAAMNDLLRPALYEAEQAIIPIDEAKAEAKIKAEIVGPICETGDYIAQNRMVPDFNSGDLLAILGAGAYGATMASTYNSRLLIPEILVKNNKYYVIKERQTYQALIEQDNIPPWI